MSGFLNSKMDGQLEAEAEEDMPSLSKLKLKVEARDERLSLLAGTTLAFKNQKWLGPKQTWLGFLGLNIGQW